MIFIAHRGNREGPNPERENTTSYISDAVYAGYDVEIDVRRVESRLFLGHDQPEQEIDLDWLLDWGSHLWIHAKNFDALQFLIEDEGLRVFYHKSEGHTLISNSGNVIWSHYVREANGKSIIPLLSSNDLVPDLVNKDLYGICSDYVDLANKMREHGTL